MNHLVKARSVLLQATSVLAIGIVGCSSAETNVPPSDGNVAIGKWGGDSAGLIVGDTAAHLHIGCTFGDVSGRIPLGTDGQFSVAGQYMLRAYPVAVGPALPAQFTGRVVGGTMTMTVTVNDTVQHAVVVRGPVQVRYGQPAQMGNCPICDRPFDRLSRRRVLLLSRDVRGNDSRQ